MKRITLAFIFLSAVSAHAQSSAWAARENSLGKQVTLSIKDSLKLSDYEAATVYSIISYYQQKQYDIINDTSLRTKQKMEQLTQLAAYRQTKLRSILTNGQTNKLQTILQQHKSVINNGHKQQWIVTALTDKGIPAGKAEKASAIYSLYFSYISEVYKDQTIKIPEKKLRLLALTKERDQKLGEFLSAEQIEMIGHAGRSAAVQ